MRTIECGPAWFETGIVGVLAGATVGQASSSQAGPTIAFSPWSRDIWLRSVGKEVFPFMRKNENRPKKVLEWFQHCCTPQDVPAGPWAGGPFLTRRLLEEYEQRQAGLPAMQWLHRGVPEGLSHGDHARDMFYKLFCRSQLQFIHAHFRDYSFQSSKVSDLFPEGIDCGGRRSRSAPGIVHSAYCVASRKHLSPEQSLRNLAVMARWYPLAAFESARAADLLQQGSLFTIDGYIPDISVRGKRLQQVATLWLGGDPQAQPDTVTESVSADLAECLQYIGKLTNDKLLGETHSGHPYSMHHNDVDTIKARYKELIQTTRLFGGQSRCELLDDRYSNAYGCWRGKEQVLSAYFPASGTSAREAWSGGVVPEFPVVHDVKINSIADYQNYELRQWAWMEELLVRTVADKLISVRVASTGETREDIAAAIQGPQPFTVAISTEELARIYFAATREVVKQATEEQADDYASRVGLALITTAYDLSKVMNAA
ncbi:hypothetical protein GNI_115020 [Gregarina niphandrodes]|uniref:Uncharacterized protein n=1 Tax=Gregarina niphandrodes TaxID=110365 RepID=A0A023B329_GRENI|nr:hypothetical protein GNI_115020 [Gregarina niphandrodes]EZG55273.1 hypothetical protein GNI_115020 [Gregarina niphandrodes]|eukprot:XP_011131652.1 hypothetical protein GNI_115020 [Gregarina niphandrodes]